MEILGKVAHEMRNVLLPIRLATAQLGQPFKDDSQLPRLRFAIERQLEHLSRLVGDLLDTSRAANGKLRLELVPLDLADVIAEALDASQGSVTSREQSLRLDLPTQALAVHGDPMRLVQIIGNLLSNASKYTLRGGAIEVSVALSDTSLQLTVADNGIGIAADVLPHVFEPFVQDAHAIAFDQAGLGIGLSVVRELVQAHGGCVVARSAGHGLGSQFVVTLPRELHAGVVIKTAAPPPVSTPSAVPGPRRAPRQRAVAETQASGHDATKAVSNHSCLKRAEWSTSKLIVINSSSATSTSRALTLSPLSRVSRSRQDVPGHKMPVRSRSPCAPRSRRRWKLHCHHESRFHHRSREPSPKCRQHPASDLRSQICHVNLPARAAATIYPQDRDVYDQSRSTPSRPVASWRLDLPLDNRPAHACAGTVGFAERCRPRTQRQLVATAPCRRFAANH